MKAISHDTTWYPLVIKRKQNRLQHPIHDHKHHLKTQTKLCSTSCINRKYPNSSTNLPFSQLLAILQHELLGGLKITWSWLQLFGLSLSSDPWHYRLQGGTDQIQITPRICWSILLHKTQSSRQMVHCATQMWPDSWEV